MSTFSSPSSKSQAIIWWKQLLSELGTSGNKTSKDENIVTEVHRRSSSLVELYFNLLEALDTKYMFEIGAHLAETSTRFVKGNLNRRAYAFEANPNVWKRAKEQGFDDRVTYENSAIGSREGHVCFYAPKDQGLEIWGSTERRAGYENVLEIEVPMTSLDRAISKHANTADQRDVSLWIDVEGTALDVLRSGRRSLGHDVGLIFAEVNDVSAYAGSATSFEVLEELIEAGFIPLARDNEWHDAWNLLAIHSSVVSKTQEIVTRWHYNELSHTMSRNR